MKNDEILQMITKLNEEKAVATRCLRNIKRFDFGKADTDNGDKENSDERFRKSTLLTSTGGQSFKNQDTPRMADSRKKITKSKRLLSKTSS